MRRLKVTCKTASTVRDGKEIKPSIMLLESIVYLDPEKTPTAESIDELKDKFIHIAAVYGLPQDEVCTCEINLIE